MKEIPLTRDKTALIDDGDLALVSQYRWRALETTTTSTCYAATKRNGATILMHVLLLGKRPGCVTDHVNGNGLDNRRANLRFASHRENSANSKLATNNRSGFKGVRYYRGKYVAECRKEGKSHYAGYFSTAEEAARAYDAKAIELHGAFARLNFRKEVEP